MGFFILFNTCHVCIWPSFVRFCYAEVALPELLEELHHAASSVSTFLRDLLARRNLCTAASRASGLAANWYWFYYDEAQGAFFYTFQILYLI